MHRLSVCSGAELRKESSGPFPGKPYKAGCKVLRTSSIASKWCVITVVPFSSVTGLRCRPAQAGGQQRAQASTNSQHGRTHAQRLHSSAGQTPPNTTDAGQVLPGCRSLPRAAVTAQRTTASTPSSHPAHNTAHTPAHTTAHTQLTPSSHLRQVWVQKVIWDPLRHAVLLLLCDHIHLESEREGAAGVEPHLCPDFEVGCQSPTAANTAQRK